MSAQIIHLDEWKAENRAKRLENRYEQVLREIRHANTGHISDTDLTRLLSVYKEV